MALSLLTVAREYLLHPVTFRERHDHPWLIWDLGRPSQEPIIAPTLSHGGPRTTPGEGDPVAFAVKKGKAAHFAMGVTFGRTENNDVVLRHDQVSRFHAYLTRVGAGHALVDAESKNGTYVEGVRLPPKRPTPLPEECLLNFGQLGVRYYSAAAFVRYLERS